MPTNQKCSIIEIYKGIPIKKSNVVRLRVSPRKYKELIDEVDRTGLSIPKIISQSGKPCNYCKGIDVIIFDDEGSKIKIKRGILSDYTIMNSGKNIITQHK